MTDVISADLIGEMNDKASAAHEDDLGALARQLGRRGIDAEAMVARAMDWTVADTDLGRGDRRDAVCALPGAGRAARYPRQAGRLWGDPAADARDMRTCFSPHIPWDKVSDYNALGKRRRNTGWASTR